MSRAICLKCSLDSVNLVRMRFEISIKLKVWLPELQIPFFQKTNSELRYICGVY